MSMSEVAVCGTSMMTCGPLEQEAAEEPAEPPEIRAASTTTTIITHITTTTTSVAASVAASTATAAAAVVGVHTSTTDIQTPSTSTTSPILVIRSVTTSTRALVSDVKHDDSSLDRCVSPGPMASHHASLSGDSGASSAVSCASAPHGSATVSVVIETSHQAAPTATTAHAHAHGHSSRDREERKEEVEERKVCDEGIVGPLHVGRPEEKKSIVMLATAMLDESHPPERRIAFNLGKMEMVADLSTTLRALGHTCRYELVSHGNMDEVVRGIKVYETVFNICDGTDVDGAVGVSLVLKLEQMKIPFAGACSLFYSISSQKSQMKALFEKHGVPTMPYRCVEATEAAATALGSGPGSLSGHLTALKEWPLFVKPDDAYGSMGISDACVCRDQEQLMAQCTALRSSGFQRLMVEGFLDGDEFSVLLTDAMAYPAVKKVYLREGALCLDFKADWIDNSYEMVTVKDDDLDARLQKVAMHAYRSVHGNSYARVDLRIHSATGEICVLEVNSQPGIGDNSTAWDILTGYALKSGQSKSAVAAQFLHQIVTHPRRGLNDLKSTVTAPAPSSPVIVRSASGSSVASDDETSSSDSSSTCAPVTTPPLSPAHAPSSPVSRVLTTRSPPLLDSEVYSPAPDPE